MKTEQFKPLQSITGKKMHIFSPSTSSSSNRTFNLFSPSPTPNFKIPTKTITMIPCSSKQPSPVLDGTPLFVESTTANTEVSKETAGSLDEMLVARRPIMEASGDEDSGGSGENGGGKKYSSATAIGTSLEEFAKNMPMFEPERTGSSREKPLLVNLDLALYRAKMLTRSLRYEEAEAILQKCISYWPEDGRAYVQLGKVLNKQSKTRDARAVYEKGCQATQGENAFIWQCWAVLENKLGNTRRARELFDAATGADKKHVAAWHGWAVLELKLGNVKKARQLLGKGLKFCGGNEYIYQTLALLEVKANRYEQARYLFRQATKCNPISCASWLAWAQLEMQQENNLAARKLFEKAVDASPKNRFAWHVWGLFEANMGNIEKARKLLKIGHALNPRDPVLLQSLALLEYKHATANLARVLFRKASELDPRHQPVWIAWGWMEWKEGNIAAARRFYQKALAINTTSESAARCLQAWGVLEQRAGNVSAARRLFRSSLNINSQSYVTWMTWAKFEEDQGNSVRAEEIRDLYFQQRTEVVDDPSWVMGFMDIIDPAVDRIKRLLKLDQNPYQRAQEALGGISGTTDNIMDEKSIGPSSKYYGNDIGGESGLDVDAFIRQRLSLNPTKLDVQLDQSGNPAPRSRSFSEKWEAGKSAKTLSYVTRA